jgi:hypothetical protein
MPARPLVVGATSVASDEMSKTPLLAERSEDTATEGSMCQRRLRHERYVPPPISAGLVSDRIQQFSTASDQVRYCIGEIHSGFSLERVGSLRFDGKSLATRQGKRSAAGFSSDVSRFA